MGSMLPSGRWIGRLGAVGLLLIGVVWWFRVALGPWYEGRPLTTWIQMSLSSDEAEVRKARRVLRTIGPEAVPRLTTLLYVERRPRFSLLRLWDRWMGVRWKEDRDLQIAALDLLKQLGTNAAPAAPAVLSLFACPDLSTYGPAMEALRAMGRSATPALLKATDHSKAKVRQIAIELLGQREVFGTLSEEEHRRILRHYLDKEPEVRFSVLEFLLGQRQWLEEDRRTLLAAVRDLDLDVAQLALTGIGHLPHWDEEIRKTLWDLRDHGPVRLRIEACRVLWRRDREVGEVLPTLLECLNDRTNGWLAALALGEMGPAAEPAIPALVRHVPKDGVHRADRMPAASALALGRIGPAAIPALVQLLHHPKWAVRISAAKVLTCFGSKSAGAVSVLPKMLTSPVREEQIVGCQLAEAIGPAARQVVPILARLVAKEKDYLQGAAWQALVSIVGENQAVEVVTHEERQEPGKTDSGDSTGGLWGTD